MENRSFQDEERANQIEEQLKEAQSLAEEADRKYDGTMEFGGFLILHFPFDHSIASVA
jgi:hypothetical protein